MFWAIVLCCVAVVLIARFLVRFSCVFIFESAIVFRLKVSLRLICRPAQGRHKYLVGFDAIQINADPDLTTIVHGVLVLKRPISRQRMQDVIQATLCRQDKFRSNIVRSELFWPYWSEGASGLASITV